ARPHPYRDIGWSSQRDFWEDEGAITGHDHMGTGADSTVLYGLSDTDPALAAGASTVSGGDGASAMGNYDVVFGAGAATTANGFQNVVLGSFSGTDGWQDIIISTSQTSFDGSNGYNTIIGYVTTGAPANSIQECVQLSNSRGVQVSAFYPPTGDVTGLHTPLQSVIIGSGGQFSGVWGRRSVAFNVGSAGGGANGDV